MSVCAVIVCGGSGERMGLPLNKALIPIGGVPGILRQLRAFCGLAEEIVIVSRAGDERAFEDIVPPDMRARVRIVAGGADRQASVYAGLAALPDACDTVLVHDGARPLVTQALIARVLDAAKSYGAAVPCLTVSDSLKRGEDGAMTGDVPRNGMYAAQTPQGFDKRLLLRAHQAACARRTDDSALALGMGAGVRMVEGEKRNIKLTTKEDIALAELYAGACLRVGHGYDAHRLVENRALVLGGVTVPHEKGLLGHSDADVAVHAVIDALLGACALGDIGARFPDTDARYAGISSITLLEETRHILQSVGAVVQNIDVTLIAQAPKLAPYIPQMRQNIARALQMPLGSVSVKATTTERMGFEGRMEGISAHAVALVTASDT